MSSKSEIDRVASATVTETSPLITRHPVSTPSWIGGIKSVLSAAGGSVYTYFSPPPPSDASIIATIKAWNDATEATTKLGHPRDEIEAQMVSASCRYVECDKLTMTDQSGTQTISLYFLLCLPRLDA
jgi:hypothetical protein